MIKVNGNEMNCYEGMTVKDVIVALEYAEWHHPILIVSLNGKHIPYKDFDGTTVSKGDEIKIFKALDGG